MVKIIDYQFQSCSNEWAEHVSDTSESDWLDFFRSVQEAEPLDLSYPGARLFTGLNEYSLLRIAGVQPQSFSPSEMLDFAVQRGEDVLARNPFNSGVAAICYPANRGKFLHNFGLASAIKNRKAPTTSDAHQACADILDDFASRFGRKKCPVDEFSLYLERLECLLLADNGRALVHTLLMRKVPYVTNAINERRLKFIQAICSGGYDLSKEVAVLSLEMFDDYRRPKFAHFNDAMPLVRFPGRAILAGLVNRYLQQEPELIDWDAAFTLAGL